MRLHEISHFALAPARAMSDIAQLWLKNPANLLSYTHVGKNIVASAELFERLTRRYSKPTFGLSSTLVDGKRAPVTESVVWRRPFCKLLHFKREFDAPSGAAAKASDRRADVGPPRHLAARHRRSLSAVL